MNESQRYERACLLAEQGRYQLAIDEAQSLLSIHPNSDRAYNIMSFAQIRLCQSAAALESAKRAITIAPQVSFHHYRLADVQQKSEQYQAASDAIATALQIEPEEPDYHALASLIYHDWGQLKHAQESAEQGLQFTPEHSGCLQLRILCQLAQDQLETAGQDISSLLQLYPNQSFAHSSQGWLRLRQNNIPAALLAFKTALQLDPNRDWARRGMMESLKAQHVVYRLILRYERWQRHLQTKKPIWILVLAIPQLRVLYGLLIVLTRLLRCGFNLVLRFHPYGCLLFTEQEKWLNNCGAIALMSLSLGVIGSILTDNPMVFILGGVTSAIAYSIYWAMTCKDTGGRYILWGLTGVLSMWGISALITLIPKLPLSIHQMLTEINNSILSLGFILMILSFFGWIIYSVCRDFYHAQQTRRKSR